MKRINGTSLKQAGSIYSLSIDFLPAVMQLAGLDLMDLKDGFRAPGLGESLVSVLYVLDRMQDREIWFSLIENNALRH